MKTYINEPKGYCPGVNRALFLALDFQKKHPNESIYVLGSLVHNENVLIQLEQLGIHSLNNKLSFEEHINNLPPKSCVIFSAHGHDKKLENLLIKKDIPFLDTTCPNVDANADKIKNAISNNHQVIYIGIKNHPESVAMLSIGKNIFLYDDIKNNLKKTISDSEPLVINQTTLSLLDLDGAYEKIKSFFPYASIPQAVCSEAKMRQEGITKMPKDVDIVFVVGGKKSNNTRKLYELAKMHFSTLKIYQVVNYDDIDSQWLKNCYSAAIISGASTPVNETMKIKIKLDEY